jgi:hypothetical protein
MPEAERVIDVCWATDALMRQLIPINELARERWRCTPAYARARLQASGVRLVIVWGHGLQCLRVRKRDVLEVEKSLTIRFQPAKRPATNRARSYAKNLTI